MTKKIMPMIYNSRMEYVDGAICFTQTTATDGAFCINGDPLIVPDTLRNTQFTVAAAGYKAYSHSIDLGDGDKQIRVGLIADPNRPNDIILPGLVDECFQQPGQFEKVVVSGKGFVTESGDWHQLNITAFKLFYNYIHGIDIVPFCSWAAQHGNTVRVFFTCRQEFDLDPNHYNEADVESFLGMLRTFSLYCEAVVFADYKLVFGDDQKRALDFYHGLTETLANHDNVFLELVNEYDVTPNQLPMIFPRPQWTISSHGSGGGDVDPVTPAWDYMTFHPGRNSEWPRKNKSAREFQDANNVPCTNNEDNRPDLAGYVVSDFSDCGFVSGILSSGTNAHSLALKHAEVPTGAELECVEMILNSARHVPTFAPHGIYVRGTKESDGPCPMYHNDNIALRTFATLFEHEAHCIIVRPTANNPREAVNGWTIQSNLRNYYHLVR